MLKSKVISVGAQAISKKDDMIILFGKNATDAIKDVSVVQDISAGNHYTFKEGSKIEFGNAEYEVESVGDLANENFQALAHTAVVFGKRPQEDSLANAIYVKPYVVPEIETGLVISYK